MARRSALWAGLMAAGATVGCLGGPAPQDPSQPVELGRVAWRRNHEEATREAREKKKPLLILFQEVPG